MVGWYQGLRLASDTLPLAPWPSEQVWLCPALRSPLSPKVRALGTLFGTELSPLSFREGTQGNLRF